MTKRNTIIAVVSMGLLIFSVAYAKKENSVALSKNLRIFSSLIRELDKLYVDTIDISKLIHTGTKTLLESLDPYTIYYPENEQTALNLMTSGTYAGMGATIAAKNGRTIIKQPYTGSPSQKVGLLPGDTIIRIDDKDVYDKDVKFISKLLQGEKGDSLSITVKRATQKSPLTFDLIRDVIKLPCIPYFGKLSDKVGYLCLSTFTTKEVAREVLNAVTELEKQGAESLILDLRNNGGGLLDQAVEMLGMFLPKNSHIVTIKGKTIEKDFYTDTDPIFPEMKIVVLINRATASAAEIVAGTLQDYDRAIIVGERSFGKGLVQNIYNLPYNGKLKLTTAKYYIPSGRCIQAIDYSHRNEDGSVGNIPDSLITAFKTKKGRTVYDGGGILPDSILKQKEWAGIVKDIIEKDEIFDYVSLYALKHKTFSAIQDFKMNKDLYEGFRSFLNEKNFSYKTASQKIIDELVVSSKDERLYDNNKELLLRLEQNFSHSLDRDMKSFKSDIEELLAYGFIIRYYNNEGAIQYRTLIGEQIKIAREIISDTDKYNSILQTNLKNRVVDTVPESSI